MRFLSTEDNPGLDWDAVYQKALDRLPPPLPPETEADRRQYAREQADDVYAAWSSMARCSLNP